MNNTRLLMLGAVVLVVLVAGYLLLSNKSTNQAGTQNPNPTQAQTQTEEQNKEASVNVTATGFEPQSLTVSVDTNVVWTNSSGEVTNVSSDNHPTHLRFPFLNLGNFDNGTTVSVVFDKAGTYAYHNHLHPEQTGTVMVK